MWEQVIASLLPAFFIHVVAIVLVECIYKDIDFPLLYKLLIPPTSTIYLDHEQQSSLGAQFINFAFYILFGIVLAVSSALGLRFLVYRFNLDTRSTFFKFNSEWYYILSGRLVDTPEYKRSFGSITLPLIYVHALVETKEQSLIYDGYLFEYELSESGDGLERIILIDVQRREMIKTQKTVKSTSEGVEKVTFVETYNKSNDRSSIGEQLMVIPYNQIKNMTLTYLAIEDVDESENTEAKLVVEGK
ncbi:hypothetical protein [Dyadobacter sp. 32]|uniref:hypothetical protein n=1 Tax=Dyadobacter sp. 32 TaxID=538966 RepID=UPI0011EF290A